MKFKGFDIILICSTSHSFSTLLLLTRSRRQRVIVVFTCVYLSVRLSVCRLCDTALHYCKVVLNFEHINGKLLLLGLSENKNHLF